VSFGFKNFLRQKIRNIADSSLGLWLNIAIALMIVGVWWVWIMCAYALNMIKISVKRKNSVDWNRDMI